MAAPEQIGDDKSQHPVTEKFEPLIGLHGRPAPPPLAARLYRARVGQRLGEQRGPLEDMTDRLRRIIAGRKRRSGIFQVRRRLRAACGTGPLPHPATQREYANWVAGWGSGPVPHPRKRIMT